jgi:hypothetical protein
VYIYKKKGKGKKERITSRRYMLRSKLEYGFDELKNLEKATIRK